MKTAMKVAGWMLTVALLIIYGVPIVYSAVCTLPVTNAYRASQSISAAAIMAVAIAVGCLLAAYGVSRMRGAARIGFLLVVILMAGLSVWLGGRVYVLEKPDDNKFGEALLALFTLVAIGLVALVYAGVRRIDRRGFVRVGIVALLAIMLVPMFHDAPPVPKSEIPADIISTWPGAEESRKVLMTFFKGGPKDLPVDAPHTDGQEVSNITVYASEVEKAWEAVAEGRKVIEKLDSFERIADFTDPAFLDIRNGKNVSYIAVMAFAPYRRIARTTWSYAQLLTERGQSEEAARKLVQLHSVSRKALPNMLLLVDKMIWVTIAGGDVQRAYRIASHPLCSREALKILKDGFVPLSGDAVSLRNPLLGENLFVGHELSRAMKDDRQARATLLDKPDESATPYKFRSVYRLLFNLTCLPNQTARDYKRYADLVVAGAMRTPPDMTAATDYMMSYMRTKLCARNLMGWYLMAKYVPNYEKSANTAFSTKIKSELMAVYLSKRLDENLVLTDPCTGKPYQLDANGVPFSVGRDGKANTDDDILLPPKEVK